MSEQPLWSAGAPANSGMPPGRTKRIHCVDLFAGAGGLSLAALRAGFFVVAAVENNPHACDTYRTNLVSDSFPVLYQQDITALSPSELMRAHFADGDVCDVVLGGPPCQGFSVHRFRNAGVDDRRNLLLLTYFEFVVALQPKYFLVENVPGMLWERHRPFLDAFYSQGRQSGYCVYPPVILDARDYGVPQRRKRVFVLGVRRDVTHPAQWPPPATHGSPRLCAENPKLKPWLVCGPVFSAPVPDGDENDVHMNHSPALVEVFRNTPPNGGSRTASGRVLDCHKNHDGHSDVYGRIDPYQPAPTMTTACINPSKGRFVHPTEHYGITVRQAARLQTFPDTFVFKGGIMAAGCQIGNAVPIRLGEQLLKVLYDLAWSHP